MVATYPDSGRDGSATGDGAASDTGSSMTDLGPGADMASTGTDMGSTGTDMGILLGDGAVMCSPGVMCLGFPTSGFPTDASAVDYCAGHTHQTDCCGARRVFGINHGARTTLCPAETACRTQYMTPAGCTDTTITADTGETTMVPDQVRVRCDPASPSGTCQCQTFVCMTDACRATSRPIGTCG